MRIGKFALSKDKVEADRQKALVYKKVFATPEGREVLYDLCNRYHVLNSHGGDALKEGQRSVVVDILARANINLELFDKMLRGEVY